MPRRSSPLYFVQKKAVFYLNYRQYTAMKGKLLPLLLLLFLGRPAASSCPDYWTQINSNCYKISPDRLNWYAAQEVKGTHSPGKNPRPPYRASCPPASCTGSALRTLPRRGGGSGSTRWQSPSSPSGTRGSLTAAMGTGRRTARTW